jgi:1-acyl-sn-glycerol-3-phosphate acyltransferase
LTSAVYSPWHPVPYLKMGGSLLSTGWILGLAKGRMGSRTALQGWALRVLSCLRIQVTLAEPMPSGGQLWVSNHLSWVDPLIYMSLRPSRAMAKAELADWPVLGGGARRIGLRFVQRECLFSRAKALRTLRADLKAGEAFLVFPEGTTTHGDRLAPLYEGSLRMAYRTGVAVLPLRLASDDAHYPWVGDDPLLPHLLALAWKRRTRVSVHPGRVLNPAQFPNEEGWMRAIRAQLEPPPAHEESCEH